MAFTLNRRLSQLVNSSGQLNTGKIPNDYISSDHIADNVITSAMLHTGFTVSASNVSSIDTDDVSEGSTNLYYTDARVGTYISGNRTYGTISSGNITTTGYIAGPSTFTIDPAAVGDNTGTVVIAGNLQVDGTTTTINSTTVTVDDLNLTLASGAANSSAANGAGITIDGASASLVWEHANDQFKFNKTIGADVNVASSNFLGDADIYALRLTNDDTTAGNTVGITFGQGGFDFTNFIASVRTGTGSDPKGDLVFGGRPSDGATFVERMRIQADGKVGIGASDPNQLFEVRGNGAKSRFNRSGSAGTVVEFYSGGTFSGGIQTNATGLGIAGGARENDLFIKNDGKVGIGTDSPDTKLHVFKATAGTITDYTNNALIVENSTDVGISLLTPNGAAGHLMFGSPGHQYHSYIRGEYGASTTSTLEFFTDQIRTMTHKNGRVGIGTDNPLSTVDVRGGNIMLGGYGGGGDYGVIFTPADSSSYWHIYNDTGGELVFGRNITIGSTELARFDSTGKLGLGVADPQHQLDISDTISAKIRLGGGTNQNGIRFNAAGNDGVTSSAYYLGVGSDLMSGTDYGAVLLDITNNRSVLFDDQSNSRLGFYNNKIFIDNDGLHVRNGSTLRLLPTDNHDTNPWLLYQYSDNTLRYNFTGYGADEIIIKYPNATNATTLLVDTELQRVGIGTSGPLATLHLKSTTTNSGPSIIFENTNNAQTMDIDYYNNAGSVQSRIQYSEGPGSFSFFPNVSSSASLVMDYDGFTHFHANRSEYGITISSAGTRSGLVLEKPGTSSVMGSLLLLSNEEYRLGTASYYHINMNQAGKTIFGNTTRYGFFDENGNLNFSHGGVINFEAASNDYSTVYSAAGYSSQGYSSSQRYWNHMISKGGTHITINSDGGHTGAENNFDDFVIWQGSQDTAEPLFRVSNAGRVVAKRNYEIGNHKTNREEFGVSAINTVDTATSDINTTVTNTYENRAGVYWLNFNSKRFRAFVQPQWLQGRNWVLAAKFFHFSDMPSGSSLWTNDESWNGGDFDLNNGHFSKYGKVWRYFGFTRLAMQMGNRIAPIMQFNSTQTLYGAFSGGQASNGGGVTANSTDPQLGNSTTYHGMSNYIGPNFTNLSGSEDIMQSYGLNKWANNSTNSTSGNNHGSANGNSNVTEGFQLTVEDAHPHLGAVDSIGRAGAWIGCPLDEGGYTFGGASSNGGADSAFGFGGCSGNTARTWTSGVAEWGKGNEVANYLPAYIWLSRD